MNKTLTEALIAYTQSDYYPFHMPGHKRNHVFSFDTFSMDITEIDGFDNLHHAEGFIKAGMEKAAKLYHADASYFLVNGSTCGILSAISAVIHPGDMILMARNSHKSAYHAAYLNQLHIHYIYPESIPNCEINGGISPEKIKKKLTDFPEIKAVFLTSPTYEGVVSDVAAIAEIVHSFHIPLIIDEAHGAHFGFCDTFPQSAVTQGADLVIQSLHKTLPSLTQTALLHQHGSMVSKSRLEKFLNIYQTSSPSYLLMASIDSCLTLLETKGKLLMEEYSKKLLDFRKEISTCHSIFLEDIHKNSENEVFTVDNSKLLLSCKNQNMSGKRLYQELREHYHLQCEMCMGNYVLAMTSCMDTAEGFSRLLAALKEIDKKLEQCTLQETCTKYVPMPQIHLETVFSIAESEIYPSKWVSLEKAKNRISADFIYLYPPGIPFVVPGERFSSEVLHQIIWYQEHGFDVFGINKKHVCVIELDSDRFHKNTLK